MSFLDLDSFLWPRLGSKTAELRHYVKVLQASFVAKCAHFCTRKDFEHSYLQLDPSKLPEIQYMCHALWGSWLAPAEQLRQICDS